mmetsp:Transcript_39735/g.96461  ORF Transcript_39735/g.96461 Transcript_39735/m.96461 type:complete len:624 (-) Transcript_39735:543-2414(-)
MSAFLTWLPPACDFLPHGNLDADCLDYETALIWGSVMLCWTALAVLSELEELGRGGGSTSFSQALVKEVRSIWDPDISSDYFAVVWNRLDLPAHTLAFTSMALYMYSVLAPKTSDAQLAWKPIASIAVLLLLLRAARVLTTFPALGPLVMMLFGMINDVLMFCGLLAICFGSFFASLYVLAKDGDTMCTDDGGEVWRILFQLPLTGDVQLDCLFGRGSYTAYALTVLYTVLVAWLLLNMLIAMMAKTFDNVWESAEENYMFTRAQLVLNWSDASLVPPPLSLLSLPYTISRRVFLLAKACYKREFPEELNVKEFDSEGMGFPQLAEDRVAPPANVAHMDEAKLKGPSEASKAAMQQTLLASSRKRCSTGASHAPQSKQESARGSVAQRDGNIRPRASTIARTSRASNYTTRSSAVAPSDVAGLPVARYEVGNAVQVREGEGYRRGEVVDIIQGRGRARYKVKFQQDEAGNDTETCKLIEEDDLLEAPAVVDKEVTDEEKSLNDFLGVRVTEMLKLRNRKKPYTAAVEELKELFAQHVDDSAEEERWRSKMMRKQGKRHACIMQQQKDMQLQVEKLASCLDALQEGVQGMHRKFDLLVGDAGSIPRTASVSNTAFTQQLYRESI